MSRIDANLRPIDATLQYWINGEWRASGNLVVDEEAVTVTSRSPFGTSSHTLDITGPFALLPHQLIPDSMRVLLYDKTLGGNQEYPMYSPAPLANGDTGLLGEITTQDIDYIGEDSVTVPAGTFLVDHYRVGDAIDIYVTGPDAVVVKWSFPRIDREHVLIQVEGLPDQTY